MNTPTTKEVRRFKVFGKPTPNQVVVTGPVIEANEPAEAQAEFFRIHPDGVVLQVVELD